MRDGCSRFVIKTYYVFEVFLKRWMPKICQTKICFCNFWKPRSKSEATDAKLKAREATKSQNNKKCEQKKKRKSKGNEATKGQNEKGQNERKFAALPQLLPFFLQKILTGSYHTSGVFCAYCHFRCGCGNVVDLRPQHSPSPAKRRTHGCSSTCRGMGIAFIKGLSLAAIRRLAPCQLCPVTVHLTNYHCPLGKNAGHLRLSHYFGQPFIYPPWN